MNRVELQVLADIRVGDAALLLQGARYPGAYYVAGYAVECALKAAIAKQIREHDFPEKKLVNDSHTHDLERLLAISGLKPQFDIRVAGDNAFAVNWTTVKDWNETTRYDGTIAEVKARDLFTAVTHQDHGVLPWLKTLW
ncbi:MAG: DNA-binding protein [Gemmatimonadales bacterium]